MKQLVARRAAGSIVHPGARAGFVPTALRLAVCGLLGSSLGLQAQTTEASKPEKEKAAENKAAPAAELPTVVVTATRNATNLMKTPVAVSALNPDDLVRQNVKEV